MSQRVSTSTETKRTSDKLLFKTFVIGPENWRILTTWHWLCLNASVWSLDFRWTRRTSSCLVLTHHTGLLVFIVDKRIVAHQARQKELLYTSFLTQNWVKPALIYLRNKKNILKKSQKRQKYTNVCRWRSPFIPVPREGFDKGLRKGETDYVPVLMNVFLSFTVWCSYAAHWCISALYRNDLLYLWINVLFSVF